MLGRSALVIALSAFGLGTPAGGMAQSAVRASEGPATILAQGSNAGHYKGQTSQHEPISFTISSGKVRNLSFWIVIGCKSRHHYRLHASGFAPIPIHAGRFALLARSQRPSTGAAIVGRVRRRRVTGSVHLKRYVRAEHGSCTGAAAYSVSH